MLRSMCLLSICGSYIFRQTAASTAEHQPSVNRTRPAAYRDSCTASTKPLWDR